MLKKTRGFETVTGFEHIAIPHRATKYSAAYDIASAKSVWLNPGELAMIPTGLKAYMQDDEWLGLYLRSSSAKKLGLSMANEVGIIDKDYYNNPDNEGHIHIMIRNNNDRVICIDPGVRIAQGIFQKYLTTDDDNATAKRVGGTGSTGA